MKITLNVGLASNKGAQSPGACYALVSGIIGEVTRSRLAQSTTEKTLICEVETSKDLPEINSAIHSCAEILHQDCIAWKHDGVGYLTGPNGAAWHPFNQEYWLDIDGGKVELADVVQRVIRDILNAIDCKVCHEEDFGGTLAFLKKHL